MLEAFAKSIQKPESWQHFGARGGVGHMGEFIDVQQATGESFHLDALHEVIRARNGGAVPAEGELMTDAVLLAEPENPYDPHAVAVQVDSVTVAYIPRTSTQRFHTAMKIAGAESLPAKAVIGWHDPSTIGVEVRWVRDSEAASAKAINPPPQTDSAVAPAGWYKDPEKGRRKRYWDGSQWTDYYATNWIARCSCGWLLGDPGMTQDDAFWACVDHSKANPGPKHSRLIQRRDGEYFKDLGVWNG